MSTSNSFNAAMNKRQQQQQPASSLDYLYEAISVVETRNNLPHQQQQHMMPPNEHMNQFYNPNEQQPQQYSLVDTRRYFNNLIYQQQVQNQINCLDPYCECNKSNHGAVMSRTNSNHADLPKIPINKQQNVHKAIKQRREEKLTEKRISNLISLANKSHQLPTSRRNISKLLSAQTKSQPDLEPLAPPAPPSRLEKAKQLARKHQLKLNIAHNQESHGIDRGGLLTPMSSSSISPSSNPAYSPNPMFNQLPQQQQQPQSVFNYYPIDMMSNLLPLYLSPYLNGQAGNVAPLTPISSPTMPVNIPNLYHMPAAATAAASTPNIDQLYFQNLVSAIYSIANYQQQQQQQQQQQLKKPHHLVETGAKSSADPKPSQKNLQTKFETKQTAPPAKPLTKLINYFDESDIENKVDEHFRRSLGSKYSRLLEAQACSTHNSHSKSKLVIDEDRCELSKPADAELSDCCSCSGSQTKPNSNYDEDSLSDFEDDEVVSPVSYSYSNISCEDKLDSTTSEIDENNFEQKLEPELSFSPSIAALS